MNIRSGWVLAGLLLVGGTSAFAETRITVEHNDNAHSFPQFRFEHIRLPGPENVAVGAKFTSLDGPAHSVSGGVAALHDGKLPVWEDEPEANFFYPGGDGGRIKIDLGRVVNVAEIDSFSWHRKERGPQVYKLYGAGGAEKGLNLKPDRSADPTASGWTRIADVDTRPKGEWGGQYAVRVTNSAGLVGKFRYLMFDISPTEKQDDRGHTFYSEFAVIDADAPLGPAMATLPPVRVDPPGDPMDWTPPADPPALRERIAPANYEAMRKRVLAGVDPKVLAAPDRPTGGLLVTSFMPESQAQRLGMKVGDILIAIDGAPVGTQVDDQELNALRTNQAQKLTYWSPGAGQKTVTIQPGPLGLWTYDGWRWADDYCRSRDRNPQWDDDVLTAASCFMDDADLAETALARGVKAGFDGRILDALCGRIYFNQGRFDDALAVQWPAAGGGRRLGAESVRLLDSAALMGFHWEQALQLARRYPRVLGQERADWLDAQIKTYRQTKGPTRATRRNPMAELSEPLALKRCDRFEAVNLRGDPSLFDTAKWAADTFNMPAPVALNIPSGHYQFFAFNGASANVSLAVHFRLRETDRTDTPYARCVWFGLFDLSGQHAGDGETPEVKVVLFDTGEQIDRVDQPPLSYVSTQQGHARLNREGTIRLAIVHDRCEVIMDDGRRLYYGPVLTDESKRKYGFAFQAVGLTGKVYPPVWEEIEDPRQSPTTQP